MKADILADINQHLSEVQAFHKQVKSSTQAQIRKPTDRSAAEAISLRWVDELGPALKKYGAPTELIDTTAAYFSTVLKFSKTSPAKKTYLELLASIIAHYKGTLLHWVQVSPEPTNTGLSIAPYLQDLTADEGEYLAEAQRCLSVDGKRACIVLGWCATISRIHGKIVEIGFDVFNAASENMTAKTYGRFKPFNKKFKIESASELRRVFDTDLLWVLEFMELIDGNQHERLRHCFEFRNNSAHPGLAPITGENLYSFYSDITKIVLKNSKFSKAAP